MGLVFVMVAIVDTVMAVYVGVYHAGAENLAFGILWALSAWAAAIAARVKLRP